MLSLLVCALYASGDVWYTDVLILWGVGAGAGGVATAARLARAGYAVTVHEKNDFTGGRCSLIHHEGYVCRSRLLCTHVQSTFYCQIALF